MQLVLASTSPYRRELLGRLGVAFTPTAPRIDESLRAGEAVDAAVQRLAGAKARAGARDHPGAAVLASDQLAELDREALGKPGTAEAAAAQLAAMSGRTVTYFTALALVIPAREIVTALDVSRVTLRRLAPEEIARYLEAESPFDCAGALKLEGRGIALCKRIETADPTALIGLPLIATAALLRAQGFAVP